MKIVIIVDRDCNYEVVCGCIVKVIIILVNVCLLFLVWVICMLIFS